MRFAAYEALGLLPLHKGAFRLAAGLELLPAVTCIGDVTVAFGAGVQIVTEGCCEFSVQANPCAALKSTGTSAATKRRFLEKEPEQKERSGLTIMFGP